MNTELEMAIKGFTPQFGNDKDRNIVERLGTLKKTLESVDNKRLRGKEGLTEKMKEILRVEESLIAEIISRNMDF